MASPSGDLDLTQVDLNNIERLADPGSRHNLGLNTAHYQKATGHLFPHPPEPNDVKQQSLGDCFLLAAVLAILVKDGGPNAVAGMMKEHQGRVVVRLHDEGGTARYVSIEKSIRKNEEKHNGGALWATMLEKAYAAATFAKTGATKDAGAVGWAKLAAGGKSDAVFKTLLGGDANRHEIKEDHEYGDGGDLFRFLWRIPQNQNPNKEHPKQTRIIREIFEGDGNLCHIWLGWRTEFVHSSWNTFLAAYGDIKGQGEEKDSTVRRKIMRLEDMERFFRDQRLNPACAEKVLNYAVANNIAPGKRGTGRYSANQLSLFNKIKEALAARLPVAVSTLKYTGALVTGKGKSAGEEISKGLAGNHAFAVVGVIEDQNPPNLKWIRIRNPWGETGREYIKQDGLLKARETVQGVFDLELNDLIKRGSMMYIGGVPIATAIAGPTETI